MKKKELIELVKKIRAGKFETEEERSEMLEIFESNVPDPEASDLIYYHKPRLTPEEIVEKALAYKPIIIRPYEDDKNS